MATAKKQRKKTKALAPRETISAGRASARSRQQNFERPLPKTLDSERITHRWTAFPLRVSEGLTVDIPRKQPSKDADYYLAVHHSASSRPIYLKPGRAVGDFHAADVPMGAVVELGLHRKVGSVSRRTPYWFAVTQYVGSTWIFLVRADDLPAAFEQARELLNDESWRNSMSSLLRDERLWLQTRLRRVDQDCTQLSPRN